MRGSTAAVLAGVAGALAFAPAVSAQQANLPDVRPLATTVVGDAGTVVSSAVSALPPAARGDVETALERATAGVTGGVFPIPFQLVGAAGPIVDPGPYPGNVPNATTVQNPALPVPGVTVRLISRLDSALALRRAVVRIVTSGPGRLVFGGRLTRGTRSFALRKTAVDFSAPGALRVDVALPARVRRAIGSGRTARLDLTMVVGAPLPSTTAQTQRARLVLRR